MEFEGITSCFKIGISENSRSMGAKGFAACPESGVGVSGVGVPVMTFPSPAARAGEIDRVIDSNITESAQIPTGKSNNRERFWRIAEILLKRLSGKRSFKIRPGCEQVECPT